MISRILQSLRDQVRHRVWIISDLQQSIPTEARRCLTTALEDSQSLALPIDLPGLVTSLPIQDQRVDARMCVHSHRPPVATTAETPHSSHLW